MDGFAYNDIFESKGIEYIAIIVFLILLIPFSILLNKQKRITRQIKKGLRFLSASILNIPQGIYYCKNHTWAFLEKNGSARIGLDDLLFHIVGEIKFTNLRNSGDIITKGDLIAELDQNGRTLSIYAPISGIILNKNSAIIEDSAILSEDPYGKGWVYRLKPTNWKAETSSYYLAEEATVWSQQELNRFKDFIAHSLKDYSTEPATLILQDGGEISDNALSELPAEAWQDFQKDFLNL
ncbi:MAG: glycine cleavage system protein H [Bacteroidales bacterium]